LGNHNICIKTYHENFINNNQHIVPKCAIKLALHEAMCSDLVFKVGAVLFKGRNRIISSGHNKYSTSSCIYPKYKNNLDSLHAEQSCLLGLDWSKIKNYNIFVLRLNRHGRIGLARPCNMCYNLISHIGLKNIYYSNKNEYISYERVNKLTINP
jgi:deoxycytidylate deaminase